MEVKSKEIEKKIEVLKKELAEAKLAESKILLIDDSDYKIEWRKESIGFFQIGKAKIILKELNEGKTLLLEHEAMGNYIIYMNPNGNRILVKRLQKERSHEVNEENVMGFIVWHAGNWYLINDDYKC